MAMSSYPIVAAIDFGTTYSGYAFSTKSDYETTPLKISVVSWVSGSNRLQSQKTPTCVLFDENKEFHSFGYEAEDKYADLALDDEHEDWYYFRRFKMELYDRKEYGSSFELKTDDGKKSMKAIDVFAACIKYLKDHLLTTADKQGVKFTDGDIQWILTVPAIWTEPGKQFMRKAADQAGVPSKHLKLVLEPEAAAIYCTNLPIDKISTESSGNKMTVFQKGTKYMILDCGGGTIDLTCHQVQKGGALHELHRANGGDWGGTSVDKEFEELLQDIVGKGAIQTLKEEDIADVLNLYRNFELKKRSIKEENDMVTITIPPILQQLCKKQNKSGDPNAAIASIGKYANVTLKSDKLQMPNTLAKKLFTKSTGAIISHVKKLFDEPKVRDASIILMVGGYSECELLQNAIKSAFNNKKVIVPFEAGLSILKGAVIYGHAPNIITTRVCRFTYGVACNRTFREGKDKEEYRVKGVKGDSRCQNGFKIYAPKDLSVELGTAVNKYTFHVSDPMETGIDLPVYASEKKDPDYVTDESCQRLGTLRIDMPDTSRGAKRSAEVEMRFGGTEIEVKAIDTNTGKETQASFNLVG